MAVDVRLYNVVMLGLSFMLMFTAFQTSSMIEVRFVASIERQMVNYLRYEHNFDDHKRNDFVI